MVFPLLAPVRKLVNLTQFCSLSLVFLQSEVSVVDLGILYTVSSRLCELVIVLAIYFNTNFSNIIDDL